MSNSYTLLGRHFENCLREHGDSYAGIDAAGNPHAYENIYRVMLGLIREPRPQPVSLLDFGCGAAHLLDFMKSEKIGGIDYCGSDISHEYIDLCRRKHPDVTFNQWDILKAPSPFKEVDYALMVGVFTEKLTLSFDEMFSFFSQVLVKLYPSVRKGMAFNLQPKQVDWERDKMFHVSYDKLAEFLWRNISKNFVIRYDYDQWQYVVYVYREPTITVPKESVSR